MMFDILDFPAHGIGIKTEEFEELSQRLVTGFDMLSDLPTRRC
jgi:hypothetical protein